MRSGGGENLLALFTSRERAETIVGDLLEQSLAHRRGWFTRQIVRVALALWLRSVLSAPARALALALLGIGVYAGVYVVLFVASGLPWQPWQRVHEASFMVPLCLVVVASNFLTGAILARRSGVGRGPRALSALLVVWVAGWLIWPLLAWRFIPWPTNAPWHALITWPAWVIWLIFPLFYVVPLLLGGLLAQSRASRLQAR